MPRIALDEDNRAHIENIDKLVEEFGESKREEVMRVYETVKTDLENKAELTQFLPIFAYRMARGRLTELYAH